MEEILKEFRALAADKVRGHHSHTAAAPIVYDYKVSKSSEGGGGVARAEAQVATRAALGKVEAAAAAAVVAALARVEVATAAAAVGATGMRMPTCSWKAVMDSPKADGFSGSGAD